MCGQCEETPDIVLNLRVLYQRGSLVPLLTSREHILSTLHLKLEGEYGPGLLFGLINFELPLALLLYHFDWKLPGGMEHDDLTMTY